LWDVKLVFEADQILIIVAQAESVRTRPMVTRIRRLLEREISWETELHFNKFIDGRTFLGEGLNDVELLLAFCRRTLLPRS